MSEPSDIARKWEGQRCLVRKLREMRDVQGSNGNWNYDAYMHGMYNGMEFALAIMEDRDPEYRDAPDEWLKDRPSPDSIRVIGERGLWLQTNINANPTAANAEGLM